MRILITGATGLIGKNISALCHERNIGVSYLTTRKSKLRKSGIDRGFYWNPRNGKIDVTCFKDVDVIINLAGSSIFKKWSAQNKKDIINSRVNSLNLLYDSLKKLPHTVKQIVSASAIGIYPDSNQKQYFEDETEISDTFLGKVVSEWESTADKFTDLGLSVTKIRTGLVLARKGGAFPKLKKAAANYMAASLGTGNQWQSWIHINDLSRMYLFVIEKELEGVFNGVAPNPVTNKAINNKLIKELKKRPIINLIPKFLVKSVFGERSMLLLESQLVSSQKIESEGFNFKYQNIRKAIHDLT